jgi:hypothetical protein
MGITYAKRARLEHRIGRPLPADDSASIANLNDVPEHGWELRLPGPEG